MGWTTLKVKKDTAKELRNKVKGKNDDERISEILREGEKYLTEEEIESLIERKVKEARRR